MSINDFILNSMNIIQNDDFLKKSLVQILNCNTNNGEIIPLIDVIENNEFISIYIEMPGINEESIELEINGNNLTIIGKKEKFYKYQSNIKIHEQELLYGKIKKNIKLPINISDKKAIDLNYTKGVLEIILNKLQLETNKIKINYKK